LGVGEQSGPGNRDEHAQCRHRHRRRADPADPLQAPAGGEAAQRLGGGRASATSGGGTPVTSSHLGSSAADEMDDQEDDTDDDQKMNERARHVEYDET
jgi:hypothetical protein